MTRPTRGTTLFLGLWRTTHAMQRVAEAHVATSGLSMTDFAVLEALLSRGPLRMSDVAEKVLLTSGATTTAVDRLVAKGLVERAADPADGRARVVELTSEGRALIAPVFRDHAATLDAATRSLSDSERSTLMALLLKLRRGLEPGRLTEERTSR